MIIRSQDKTKIVNFNNVKAIEINYDCCKFCSEVLRRNPYKIIAIVSDNVYIFIGMYNTEERAIEILGEIIKCVAVNLDIFDMPEE